MVNDSADAEAEALRATLAAALAERDRLRAGLEAAGEVIEHLRGDAQVASKAKADFMARMTHEMRTPLSAIIGLANLALPLLEDSKLIDYLAKIVTSARSLLGVVDDITDFSRLEKGLADLTPVPFDLDQALNGVARLYSGAAEERGLVFFVRRAPSVPTRLVGDKKRLAGILSHLVGNAVKFTEKGRVEISVELLGREGGTVRLAFCVSDTGIGMDQASVPDMLESFTQADGSLSRPYGGTGLGLAIVKRGVALLGGELIVTSHAGRGSQFRFDVSFAEDGDEAGRGEAGRMPASQPPVAIIRPSHTTGGPANAAPPAAFDKTAPQKPLANTLILLVEDNAINQQVARETLERFGASVDVAQNGREAVEMVQAAFYDVVLMDVQMPVMDGLTATRLIRTMPGGAELPIVALTAHALAEDHDRCLEAGMNDYLTKPIDPLRLLASLGQWIAPAAAAANAGSAVAPVAERKKPATVLALDAGEALRRLGGNERLLLSVAAEFTRDYAGAAATLDQLLAAGDTAEARRLAHTLKGVAGNISAEALSVASRDMEAVLADGKMPGPVDLAAFKCALAATLAAASKLSPPPQEPPESSSVDSWRILLVDDAKLNRAIFSQILRAAGHEVITAVNGKEACRLLFGERPSGGGFDLILMDIEMPEMDGLAATRVIRGLLTASANPPCAPGIPIVALTAHESEVERARCLEAGMDECLHKIFEPVELLANLGRVMSDREPKARQSACPRPTADSGPAMAPLLRCMAGHLAEGSIRADEDMAVLREAFTGRMAPPELAELSRAIERYEFAAALKVLGRLAPLLGVDPSAVEERVTGATPA
ncbi:MAG: response regulator [Solidesulfovibrio sp.]